jgi:alpha/beta superfamily hydrolase
MPGKNDFLERPVTINSGDLVLEGLIHQRDSNLAWPGVVICPPHPRFGGNMDNPLVWEIAFQCFLKKFATMRFNYRGVGASQGDYDDGRGELDDVKAALDEMKLTANKNHFFLVGYSFGAWLAAKLAARDDRVKAFVLISPPISQFDFSELKSCKSSLLIVSGQFDQFTSLGDLNKWIGENDVEAELYGVPRADHFFSMGMLEAAKKVVEFFLGEVDKFQKI